MYPNIPSSIASVPHCEDLPIPIPPSLPVVAETYESEDSEDDTFNIRGSSSSPHFPTQPDLNNLVRDLSFTKEDCENVKILMDMLSYTRHNWDVCRDFKVPAFLL